MKIKKYNSGDYILVNGKKTYKTEDGKFVDEDTHNENEIEKAVKIANVRTAIKRSRYNPKTEAAKISKEMSQIKMRDEADAFEKKVRYDKEHGTKTSDYSLTKGYNTGKMVTKDGYEQLLPPGEDPGEGYKGSPDMYPDYEEDRKEAEKFKNKNRNRNSSDKTKSMANGGYVMVKTKLGRNKPTKIC